MQKAIPRILITPGEPAGIGPDLVVQLAQQPWPVELVVASDLSLLQERAQQLGLPLQVVKADLTQAAMEHQAGVLKVIYVPLAMPCRAGELNPANATHVMHCLEVAAAACLQNKAQALVTGPVHKGVMNQADIPFRGHTEFFAHYCHVPHTIMLFVVDEMKVALATTHLPLVKVSQAITKKHLQATLVLLHEELKKRFHVADPRIVVCGLNPHAGEGGYLGEEEIHVIEPVLKNLRQQGMQLLGPLSADTVFIPQNLQSADAVLAMYHDQALPVIKHLGFGHAVNMTLGLPFLRTSVDHGTALDIAGTKKGDASSFIAALKLAINMI